jgi:hypothetical protein
VLTEQGWKPLAPGGGPAGYATGPGASGTGQPAYQSVQPAYQPTPGTGGRKRLWIAIAVVAVLFVGVLGAAVVALTNARNGGGGVASPAVSSSTVRASASPSSTSEGKAFDYGDAGQLTLDGVAAAEITVEAPVEFTSTNQADKAEKGRLVYVPVTMKVTGKEKVSINPLDFEVVLPDGQHLDAAEVTALPQDAPALLDSTDVAPGRTLTGSVPFDVPASTPLKVAYSPDLDVLGTWK